MRFFLRGTIGLAAIFFTMPAFSQALTQTYNVNLGNLAIWTPFSVGGDIEYGLSQPSFPALTAGGASAVVNASAVPNMVPFGARSVELDLLDSNDNPVPGSYITDFTASVSFASQPFQTAPCATDPQLFFGVGQYVVGTVAGQPMSCTTTAGFLTPATDDNGDNGEGLSIVPSTSGVATVHCTFQGAQIIEMATSIPDLSTSNACSYELASISNLQFSISELPTTNPTSSISISSASFEQVVENPQIGSNPMPNAYDAVKGKSSSFSVLLSGNNLASAPANSSVKVQITDSAGTTTVSSPILVSDIAVQVNTIGSYVVLPSLFPSYVPQTSGTLTITIIPSTAAITVGLPYTAMSLNVHQVTAGGIGFTQLDVPNLCLTVPSGSVTSSTGPCASAPTEPNVAQILKTDTFLSALFPVPDANYTYSSLSASSVSTRTGADITSTLISPDGPICTGTGAALLQCQQNLAIAQDLMTVEYLSLSTNPLNRGVGIVSQFYFAAHGLPGATGYTQNGFLTLPTSVLVSETSPVSIPHELAHSYGQSSEYYSGAANTYLNDPVAYVLGYDASSQPHHAYTYPFPDTSNPAATLAWSIMGPAGGPNMNGLWNPGGFFNYWIDKSTYDAVFDEFVSPRPIDPQTIAVSGVLTESGKFIFGPSQNLASGTVSPSNPSGNVSISTLDSSGNLLDSISFQSSFTGTVSRLAEAVGGASTIDLTAMPVVVQLPASSSVETIQITQKGNVIAKSSLSSQILQGIIASIPSAAFEEPDKCKHVNSRDPHEVIFCQNYTAIYQDRLDKLVARIQKHLSSKHPVDAVRLFMELIGEFERVTIRNYEVSGELSQKQVLTELEQIVSGIERSKDYCEQSAKNHKGK